MAKKSGKLAVRYARALLASVEKELGTKGSPSPAQKTAEDLSQLAALWQSDSEFSSVMLSPMFARDQRSAALQGVLKEAGVSELNKKFLRVVFDRDRISYLPEIAQAFSLLADQAALVLRVTVSAARKISAKEVKDIENVITTKLGGKPQFEWKNNPELLGGLVIEYSGQVLDGSLRGQLDCLEKELTS